MDSHSRQGSKTGLRNMDWTAFYRRGSCLAVMILLSIPIVAQEVSWPQFRGPDAMPVSDHPGLPVSWSDSDNVEWSTDIPGMGWSSPVVWGNKVFLTSATSEASMKQPSLGVDFSPAYARELTKQGKTREEVANLVRARDNETPDEVTLTYNLFCLELETGRVLWRREFHHGPPPTNRHRKNSYTSETPVTDGRAVYVYVAFLGLYAFDFDGKQLWTTPLQPHVTHFGAGSSPALHGDRLFVLNDNEDASFIAAYDKGSGRQLWRTSRSELNDEKLRYRSGWSTPFVWRNDSRTEVVTTGPGLVISYDLDGGELWRMKRMSRTTIQSPFSWGGMVYVTSGAGGALKPIAAIRPGAEGDITPPEESGKNDFVAWLNPRAGGTYMPTPVIYEGGLYVLSDKGILARFDPRTGKETYKSRIHPQARNFTSSPWAYAGRVFCINEEGNTFVIKAGEEFELLAINRLGGFTMATPAIAGDRLLIRTQERLFSIRDALRKSD